MVVHYYYAVTTPNDFERKLVKGGETGDPYMRLKRYGTFAHRDDKAQYILLISCELKEELVRPLESNWMSRFEKVEESFEDTENLNRAATIEGFRCEDIKDLEQKFLTSCEVFGIDKETVKFFKTDEEISTILKIFKHFEGKPSIPKQTITSLLYSIKREEFQKGHIQILREFFTVKHRKAGLVVAPCGYGKTVVAAKSIKGCVDRLFICVPTTHLKRSWEKALIEFSGFTKDEIYEIGGDGENNPIAIKAILKKERFILLLCYASSPLLYALLNQKVELGIFDEAHRLAGIAEVAESEQSDEEEKRDIGRTKRLIRKCYELDIQRLSLTFTPKGFIVEETCEDTVNSNDDVQLFGEQIIKVSLRDMIQKGLLPPYKILFPQVKKMFEGLKAKVQLMLHEFMKEENGKYAMNHLVVFAATHSECREIIKAINELLPENHTIEIQYLDTATSVKGGIKKFSEAKRSIIVNCLLLGEGVDVPIADSVCVLCNKKSYTQIIQMLLRPGRYFEGKEYFYMIMALNDEDDADFIGFAIEALTYIDPHLDKQVLRVLLGNKQEDPNPRPDGDIDSEALQEIIQSDEAEWYNIPKIRKCLEAIVRRRIGGVTTRFQFELLRKSCRDASIRNTSSYNKIRSEYSWPEEPWKIRDMTAYEFFHGEERVFELSVFKTILQRNGIVSTEQYVTWQKVNSEYPSMEDINDGYFGRLFTNFQTLIPSGRRR